MILVIGVLVIVAAAIVLLGGSAGSTLFDRPSRPARSGLGPPLALLMLGGVVLVALLLGVAVLGLGDLRSARSTPEPDEPAVQLPERERVEEDPPASVAGSESTFDGIIRLDAERSELRPSPTIGDLASGNVLDVRATGFVDGAEGVIAQCPELRASVCTNLFPVRADASGRVRVPYRLVEGSGAGTLVIEIDSERVGAGLVFGEAAPGLARVSADNGVVQITGGSPGATVRVARCDSDSTALDQCAIGPSLVLARDGSGRIEVAGGREARRIVLVDDQGIVLADPVALRGRPGPEVDHDPLRLLLGFGLALALVGIAIALIRSTDWRVSAEGATPFLDAAALDG